MEFDFDRIRFALEAVIADLDYDQHKNLLRGEDDGEDHYDEVVNQFVGAYIHFMHK